jgi:hypothetical protein
MSEQHIQKAPVSGEVNIPDENKSKLAAIPQKYRPRFETNAELKAFIDEVEFLRRIPVSRRTLFSWVQSGKIPCVKIGRRKIYHWASCEAALLRLQRGAE